MIRPSALWLVTAIATMHVMYIFFLSAGSWSQPSMHESSFKPQVKPRADRPLPSRGPMNTSLLNSFFKPTEFGNSKSTKKDLPHPYLPLCRVIIVTNLTELRKHLIMRSESVYHATISKGWESAKKHFHLLTLPRSWHATLTRSESVFSPSRTQTRGS
jgi:hypothetical protein